MVARSFFSVCAFAALVPVAVAAGPFDGVYKQTATSECSLVGVAGGSLKIEESVFYGVDVQCRMTRPVDITGMEATLYDMQCAAETETWTERAMLMLDADQTGLYMVWDGYVFRYDRCEEGEY